MVDLLAACLARELDAEAALPEDARQRAMVENVRAFIRRNLHDPELSLSAIAAAHHISVSYLHRVFSRQSRGETVAAWIRGQRLEQARHDLENPALYAVPIHAVAARWGSPAPPTSAAPSGPRTASRPASTGIGRGRSARASRREAGSRPRHRRGPEPPEAAAGGGPVPPFRYAGQGAVHEGESAGDSVIGCCSAPS